MISKKKRYKYNTETLTFVEVKAGLGIKIKKSLLFFLCANFLGCFFFFLLNSMMNSPEVIIQNKRINKQTQKYYLLSGKLDSLTYVLKGVHFTDDKMYRDVLEMALLSDNIRYAGTGGYDPYARPPLTYTERICSNLLTKIDNLKNQIKIQDDSYEQIMNEAIIRNRKLESFPAITPIKFDNTISISSYFGSRGDPFTFNMKEHTGIDFVGQRNTKIFSTAKGTVTFAEQSRTGYGNEVIIDHGFGYYTIYAHLNKILVTQGQMVLRGDLVGLMGSTGRSTGTHLHYEVRLFGKPINPAYFFADNLTPDEFDKLTN